MAAPPDVRAFRAASRAVVRELGFLRAAWAPAGLTHARVHALIELEDGPLTGRDLAARLHTDKAAISRTLRALADAGLVRRASAGDDRRARPVELTDAGRARLAAIHHAADAGVRGALATLSPDEQRAVERGMALYAKGLARARLGDGLALRELTPDDDPQVRDLIQAVMPEHGASGPGFALHDPEVQAMSAAYPGGTARYFVVARDGAVLGGAGFAPLAGGAPGTCELRKMYFRPELRGLGVGARLLAHVLDAARQAGFTRCYLETLDSMGRARRLYEAFGFARLSAPEGATGHFGCDAWYARDL